MQSIEGHRDVTLLRQQIKTAKQEVVAAMANDDESRTKGNAALTQHQASSRMLLLRLADLLMLQALQAARNTVVRPFGSGPVASRLITYEVPTSVIVVDI